MYNYILCMYMAYKVHEYIGIVETVISIGKNIENS